MSRNIKTVLFLLLTMPLLSASYGTSRASFIWADGKVEKGQREKSMEKGYSSFQTSISTEGSF